MTDRKTNLEALREIVETVLIEAQINENIRLKMNTEQFSDLLSQSIMSILAQGIAEKNPDWDKIDEDAQQLFLNTYDKLFKAVLEENDIDALVRHVPDHARKPSIVKAFLENGCPNLAKVVRKAIGPAPRPDTPKGPSI